MYKNSIVTKKLVRQPVFVSLVHLNVFMGPCRYGVGERLTYDYEKKESLKTFQFFNEDLKNYVDHGHVELLESKYLEWHEDFAVKEESIEDVLSNNEKVDVYLFPEPDVSYVSTVMQSVQASRLLSVRCPTVNIPVWAESTRRRICSQAVILRYTTR